MTFLYKHISLALIVLVFAVSGCTTFTHRSYQTVTLEKQRQMAGYLIRSKNFLGLFHKADMLADRGHPRTTENNLLISEPIMRYLVTHNIRRFEDVKTLLEENGFDVREPGLYQRKYDNDQSDSDPAYDGFVRATKRGTTIHPFVSEEYYVLLYLYQGNVAKAVGGTTVYSH